MVEKGGCQHLSRVAFHQTSDQQISLQKSHVLVDSAEIKPLLDRAERELTPSLSLVAEP